MPTTLSNWLNLWAYSVLRDTYSYLPWSLQLTLAVFCARESQLSLVLWPVIVMRLKMGLDDFQTLDIFLRSLDPWKITTLWFFRNVGNRLRIDAALYLRSPTDRSRLWAGLTQSDFLDCHNFFCSPPRVDTTQQALSGQWVPAARCFGVKRSQRKAVNSTSRFSTASCAGQRVHPVRQAIRDVQAESDFHATQSFVRSRWHVLYRTTGWTVGGSNPSRGEIFRAGLYRPCCPCSLLFDGYRNIKCPWGVVPSGLVVGWPLSFLSNRSDLKQTVEIIPQNLFRLFVDFTSPIFTKARNTQQHFVEITCTKFQPNAWTNIEWAR